MRSLIYHIFPKNLFVVENHLTILSHYVNLFDAIYIKLSLEDKQMQFNKSIVSSVKSTLSVLPNKKLKFYYYNNKHGSEPVYFLNIIEEILSNDPNGITFYAHAKGSSVVPNHPNWNKLENIWKWSRGMYYMNLQDIQSVERLLTTYSCLGAFKRGMGDEPHDGSIFHYSGSFYWMSNKQLLKSNWKNISNTYFGCESYPGRVFSEKEAFCWYERDINKTPVERDLYFTPLEELEYLEYNKQ